jgi:uncharacterized protein DUF6766
MDTVAIVLVLAMAGTAGWLVWAMFRSIQQERRSSGVSKLWPNFGLGIVLAILFFGTWAFHGVAQWQVFEEEQRVHNQPIEVSDFIHEFSESTLENWQSEFLQLFSFVVLSALYLHRGSAESRDSEDRMEEMLKEIKKKLDA